MAMAVGCCLRLLLILAKAKLPSRHALGLRMISLAVAMEVVIVLTDAISHSPLRPQRMNISLLATLIFVKDATTIAESLRMSAIQQKDLQARAR